MAERYAGVIRIRVDIGNEKRVMFVGTRDVGMRMRKLVSDRKLGKLGGRIFAMAEKFHAGKLVFDEVCRCEEVDLDKLVEAYGVSSLRDGFVVCGKHGLSEESLKWCVYARRYKGLLDRVVEMAQRDGEDSVLDRLDHVCYGD
jgi:hypothetical protein